MKIGYTLGTRMICEHQLARILLLPFTPTGNHKISTERATNSETNKEGTCLEKARLQKKEKIDTLLYAHS